jgi:hypothetical protein
MSRLKLVMRAMNDDCVKTQTLQYSLFSISSPRSLICVKGRQHVTELRKDKHLYDSDS